ncbi:dihydrofolate reductase [Devosia sp. LjRoot3]
MPSATSIVARSYPDHVIGIENRLPWRLRTDLALFKSRTVGHAIIMGRRTFESLGRPLPGRLNIVLSREPFPEQSNVQWARDVSTALLMADIYAICNLQRQFFVIGGERIYREFSDVINRVWLTEVFSGRINGDAKFDFEFSLNDWWSHSERDYPATDQDEYPFRITCWVRRKPQHRERFVDEFRSSDSEVLSKLNDWLALQTSNPMEDAVEQEQLSLFPKP